MAYNRKFVYESCTEDGRPVELYLLRREDTASEVPPVPITASDSPFTIEQKDADNDLFKPINSSDITLNLLSSDTFNANTISTEDEREWRVDVYIDSALYWTGFVLPEEISEPYDDGTYEITVMASAGLNPLADIQYIDEFFVYRGFASDKDVLTRCLLKTGLELPIWIGVNTFESHMTSTVCPLAQAEIEQERFLDQNNIPFSCYEVIRSILARWSARLYQTNGKWVITNVLEQAEGEVKYWKFTSSGTANGSETVEILSTVDDPGTNVAIVDGTDTVTKARAIKSATSYYQYGFTTNAVLNGDFNEYTPGDQLPAHWNAVGAVTAGTGTSTITNPATGEVITTGYYLIIANADLGTGAYVENDTPISVRANQNVNISFEVWSELYLPQGKYEIEIALHDGAGNYFTKTGWKPTGDAYRIETFESELWEGLTVNFEIPYAIGEYQLYIDFGQIYLKSDRTPYQTNYDNLSVNIGVSDSALSPPVGSYVRLTQNKVLTTTPDPILILHGDEPIDLRTSQIKVGGAYTSAWARNGITEIASLLYIIADSLMRTCGRPRRILMAEFKTPVLLSAMTILDVPLLDGQFLFMSGDFDPVRNRYNLILSEIFTDEIEVFQPYEQAQDYGQLSDKDGKSVGTPTGVNNPPPAQITIDAYTKEQVNNFFGGDVAITGYNKGNWDTAYSWGDPAGVYLPLAGGTTTGMVNLLGGVSIPTKTSSVIDGVAELWVDKDGTGGGGTPPVVIVNLTDLQDVAISSPTNGQALVYDSATGKWKNASVIPDLSAYYTKTEINAFFSGSTGITGYNKTLWDKIDTWATLNNNINGKAGDSWALNGAAESVTPTANSIVKRDGSGYGEFVYVKTTNTTTLTSGIVSVTGKIGADSYLHQFSAGAVQAFVGINTGATLTNNITGTAGNATLWNGISVNISGYTSGTISSIAIYNTTNSRVEFGDQSTIRSFLGLGSNAYTSTAYYPISGGTISGDVRITRPSNTAIGLIRFGSGVNSYLYGTDSSTYHVFAGGAERELLNTFNYVSYSAFSGAVEWGSGSYVPGVSKIYNTAANGAVLVGKTGSSNDFVLNNGIGNSVFIVPTGTPNITFIGMATASGGLKLPTKNTGGTITGTAELWVEV